ncbi:TrlF family AAA-like ATPase [Acinetobacter baumannii]|uniref:TrlF family AAA-like ATPase n=1 Tax=Acinetobacter baumannii TaxID=470 RepID=UPI0015D3A7DE|nr:AAA family ATPase [Acinetobacter baumannii]MBI1410830.1 histidinol phosphatase [Acinetobacter baumannii]MBI1430281.1 histidinol phosphatase [Acinetobacter baumannii]QLI39068.1 histidinol phosphatase [Acinetobacter baumannii]
MSNILGSQWYKFDFHTHTPASLDYREPSAISPQDWLKALMEKEIDCVAITDHNSGQYVDTLKSTYSQSVNEDWFRTLTMFPGFELTVSLGASRIHLLAIFDPSISSAELTMILGSCQLNNTSLGDPENCFSTLSITDAVKRIKDANGIVMPAHIEGPKGILHNITTSTPDLKEHLKLFDSAQFINPNHLIDPELNPELKTNCQHLAIVKGSDAHTLAQLGASFSWIKMGTPNIDGLKYALRDKNYCIRNQIQNPNQIPQAYIKTLTIKNMKYCGRRANNIPTFQLHPLFNAIIGGRGTGKSTFIESLRLSLGKSEDTHELDKIHSEIQSFIDEVTFSNTEIDLSVRNHASEYCSKWSKSSALQFYKYEEETLVPDQGNIQERFPVHLYSQKQINALASHPNILLQIIDRSSSVTTHIYKDLINTQNSQVMNLLEEERRLNHSISMEGSLTSELSAIETDIASFNSGGHNHILLNHEICMNLQRAITLSLDVSELDERLSQFSNTQLPTLFLENINGLQDPLKMQLVQINSIFSGELSNILQEVGNLKIRLDTALAQASTAYQNSSWTSFKNGTEHAYQTMLADYNARSVSFDSEQYESWNRRKQEIINNLQVIDNNKQRLINNLAERQNCINEITRLRSEIQQRRQTFIDSILSNNNYVKMTVIPYGETENIESTFRDIIGTSNFVSTIYNPEDKERCLLNELINCNSSSKLTAQQNLFNNIINLINGISIPQFNINGKFTTYLQNRYQNQPEFLGRLLTLFPEDLLEVKYSRKGDGRDFVNISRGSAGQKAAAILAFLLSHGNEPIIIDQPEDDLDNELIYDLIVNQIHNNKNKRQIIIVTHNPNIVVNGDADLVNVMHFNGQIEIKNSGSLVHEAIRNDVCQIMEGGKDAFRKRYERIGSFS